MPLSLGICGGFSMMCYTILLDETTAEFYTKVAASAQRAVETVLSDALFKLAGELSLNALAKQDAHPLEAARSDLF